LIFGEFPVADNVGAILAHSARLSGRTLKKGHVLTVDDVAALAAAGYEALTIARLEDGDIPEDEAAAIIAEASAGPNVRVGKAFTGRCNLFAECDGVIAFDRSALDRLNLVDEAVTIATPTPYTTVTAGQMIATIKIIPFAAPKHVVDACAAVASQSAPLIRVAAFRSFEVGLIMTRLPGMKERLLDSTATTVGARLERFGSHVKSEIRCDHDSTEVAEAVRKQRADGCDMVLIFGASATVDRRDTVPAGVVEAGGEIDHFGMPVDPGNLLFLAHHGDVAVVGMPGCARSPQINGFDWVLWRLLAEIEITPADIMVMGGDGLLKETRDRAQPRRRKSRTGEAKAKQPKIGAIVLAAGASTRMGETNKLLANVGGIPMVVRAAEAAIHSRAAPVVVVTGHEAERVAKALDNIDVRIAKNPNFAQGMSTSLRAGLKALPEDVDGVVVLLGDMPQITSEHIDRLIDAFDPVERRSIVVPMHGRKRGNPILWDKRYIAEMTAVSGDVGARYLLEEHADQVCEVAIPDDGVLIDVDTPERLEEITSE
jgi:molybdenum cofactor cytidylyltransferase